MGPDDNDHATSTVEDAAKVERLRGDPEDDGDIWGVPIP